MKADVIVIGGNHHNTLSVLRSLGERGIQSSLILISNQSKPYVGYSRYAKNKKVIPSIDELKSAMYSLRRSSEKTVVIACSDSVSSFLDENYHELSNDYFLPGCEGNVIHYMNKATMAKVALESGLNVPRSWIITPPIAILLN